MTKCTQCALITLLFLGYDVMFWHTYAYIYVCVKLLAIFNSKLINTCHERRKYLNIFLSLCFQSQSCKWFLYGHCGTRLVLIRQILMGILATNEARLGLNTCGTINLQRLPAPGLCPMTNSKILALSHARGISCEYCITNEDPRIVREWITSWKHKKCLTYFAVSSRTSSTYKAGPFTIHRQNNQECSHHSWTCETTSPCVYGIFRC